MPKIIENVRSLLIEEAKNQIAEKGYGKTTIRSIASACGLAVGTVYNYFPSKDMLIASFMAEEWQKCLCRMRNAEGSSAYDIILSVYSGFIDYMGKHTDLFSDKEAAKVFATVFSERHKQLRSQIAEIIAPACESASVTDKAFLAEFIAESLLSWSVAGKSFEEQYSVISQLLK